MSPFQSMVSPPPPTQNIDGCIISESYTRALPIAQALVFFLENPGKEVATDYMN